MRSRLLAVSIALIGATACGGADLICASTSTAPCDPDGGGGGNVTTGFVSSKTVVDGGTTYKYQVFIPANYNAASTTSVPVILFLHGSGEKGSDNVAQTTVGLGPVVKAQLATFPAIVVFPQAPAGEGGNDAFDRVAVAALDKTMSEYGKADPTRIYLTGLSYGGIRGYEIAYRNPTKFAAWVPISASICGDCLSAGATQQQGFQLAAQALETLPVWEFHGQLDTQISVNDSYAIRTAFTANGDPYTLTVYPTGGHAIWDAVYARADMWTWLDSKQR